MAARERKSTLNKQLNKDGQADGEKTPVTPKIKRSRKSASSLANDNKTNSEQKSPVPSRKRKKENAADGRSTPNAARGRRLPLENAAEEELTDLAKTPPPSGQKARKAFLEKELEDILENATGRNTPSISRRKLNEKEDDGIEAEKLGRARKLLPDGLEGLEEKGGFFLPKPRKGNDKDLDDDNISVKSFSTLLRGRKNFDKEIDDDLLSVRSMSVRSKKGDANEDDTMSVRSLPRPNKVKKVERKKKAVISPNSKKKILLKKARASPKKGSDIKKKVLQKKKPQVKAIRKDSGKGKEKKRVIKKPINIQTKKKAAQKRLQTAALLIKKQRLKKPKNPDEKRRRGKQNQRAVVPSKENNSGKEKTDVTVEHVQTEKERLIIDHVSAVISEVIADSESMRETATEETNKIGKVTADAEAGAAPTTTTTATAAAKPKAKPRRKQVKKVNPVGMAAAQKRRRESNIHFEMTPSLDDSEVIIVQPRLGPRKQTNRRKKAAAPAETTAKPRAKKVKTKDVTTSMLPNALPATVTSYSTIGTPYILPNYNLLGNNQQLVRNFNSNATVSPNFDPTKTIGQNNLPYSDSEPNAYGPKVSSNEILITQTGIMLSGGRIVPSVNQHPGSSNVRFPNSSPGFVPDSGVMYSPQIPLENPSLIYQNSTNVIQPQSCPTTNTAMLIKKPELMSTSLISTAAGTIVISPSGNVNNISDISLLKPQTGFTASTQTDTDMSEKALEGDTQTAENISILNKYRNVPRMENLPTIPVAKSVNDLLLLKSKSEMQMANDGKTEINHVKPPCESVSKDLIKVDSEPPKTEPVIKKKKLTDKRKRRTLRNVRINQGSGSELTFSEPESCVNEAEGMERLYKTISCERLLNPHKPSGIYNLDPHVLYEFGSEPITISDAITPFETASSFNLPKKEIMENKIDMDKINGGIDSIMTSPKAKEAAEVCNFSKENEEALKELGLDSDMDQTKSEGDTDSPPKTKPFNQTHDDTDPVSKKAKMKEEVDHVLREMPIRRIPNLYRRTDCNSRSPQNRLEMKNPLVVKNNDYLSKSPVKAPTVIDKLLEKNKSLKKAEQEGKFQNSVRNLSENFEKYEEKPIKRSSREARSRKFTKDAESRKIASKKFANDSANAKIFERRGSNPEVYSNDYQVANENLPLRRVTDPGDKFQRRGSIDYDSIQKVMDRRCSLPEDSNKVKIPKNAENVNKLKTEPIKTIVVGSSSNSTSKNRGADGKPRIINIVTSVDGTKKGQNLMEEIGMDALENCYVNGDKAGRRTSVESCNSETENLKKLMDGLPDVNSDGKLSKEVPYCEGKTSRKFKGSDKRKDEQKSAISDESPEDLATKETILSALGLQSLKAAAQNAQKKKDNQLVYQSDTAGYTGTLKTVIKIQRQEKKGSSKAPLKMIYKASSSNSTPSAAAEEVSSLEPEIDVVTAKEDADESEDKNGNGKAKSLVIPEKASSFSIHPGRMCSDVCTYCFGKFGLLDTPCHIAQLKDADKRGNILATESHLTADSCLCDACFRHVDKKSNCPTFTDKKTEKRKYTVRKQICCVQNCNSDSQHSVRRKSFLKLKKSIGRKITLDPAKLEKLQPAHLVTLCHRHIYWIDYFMSCGICKKRLTSVNMYRVGPDVNELNAALSADGIPTILTDKRFLCKICNCYASIRTKCKEPSDMSSNQCQFYENYRKRILQCHGIEVPDSEAEENDNGHETKSTKTKNRKLPKPTATITNEIFKSDKSDNDADGSAEESTKISEKGKDSEVKQVTHMNIPPKTNGNLDFGGVSIAPTTTEVNPTQIHVKLGNLNIGALGNLNIGQDVRHGTRPGDMQCFPTETELALRAHFELTPAAEDQSAKAQRKGFEKCTTTIQFNEETKNLFYNLQMPYGNHSSFFRHLILLEKYFRNGDLVIGRNADPKAVNYISSVQNRIRSYEGIHNPPPPPPPAPTAPPAAPAPPAPAPIKKPVDIPPSLSIVPQPVKAESRAHETKSSVIPSRPFTLTPMPSTVPMASFSKTSPLSQMQATVQNIPTPPNQNLNQGIMGSFLKSVSNSSSKGTTSHPKPEISITSVPNDSGLTRNPNKGTVSAPNTPYLTSKLQENLKKLATNRQNSKPTNQAKAVILNRTIGGQKQSLVQVTTGGKTIHLTLTQFRRIQQMQIRKKQYLEHQAKLQRQKEESKTGAKSTDDDEDDDIDIKHLSPELEIQEVKQTTNGNEVFPIISDVRTLSGEDSSWDKKSDSNDGHSSESFPKIPKTLSVSVTKIPPPDYSLKEQSVDPVE